MNRTLQTLFFLVFILTCSINAWQVDYDIQQRQIENLLLETDEYFISASLLYPGLQSDSHFYSTKRDSIGYKRHLILGSNLIDDTEKKGTTYISPYYNTRMSNGYNVYYSPICGLYGSLMNEFNSFDGGMYLGSLQLNSKTGELSGNRYGFRAAAFIENHQGFFGGTSAILHFDKMSRFNSLRTHSRFDNGDTIIEKWQDRELQKFSDYDLSFVSSIFPFGRSADESKMILLDLYGAQKVDSLSDTLSDTWQFTSGSDSTVKPKTQKIPYSIHEYFFNNQQGNAGISFIWTNAAHSFFKVRIGASYSRVCTDTISDSTIVVWSRDENMDKIKGHETSSSLLRFDTSGAQLGLTERLVIRYSSFTFITGFDGTISVKLFRNEQNQGFGGNVGYYFDNSSLREYKLAVPLAARWERKNFALDLACYPSMTSTHLIDHKRVVQKKLWSFERISLGCTLLLKDFKFSFIPVFQGGTPNLSNAELHYMGKRP